MRRIALAVILLLPLILVASKTWAQTPEGIDPEALVKRILTVDSEQQSQVKDVSYDAEYVEKDERDNGEVKEKVRLIKRIYVKYLPDTAWYHEDFREYYKEGKLQSPDDLKKEAADRKEKKRRRGAMDISYPMLKPFWADHRALYNVEYKGIPEERIDDRRCHHFTVTAKVPADSLINGDYYFEVEGFHLARVDFSPSQLVHRTMFKMSEFNMSLIYAPNLNGLWLPSEFNIQFKAKAMWVIGIKVKGAEYYRNPVVNSGLEDKLFDSDRPTE
jgi:hypothetical protein